MRIVLVPWRKQWWFEHKKETIEWLEPHQFAKACKNQAHVFAVVKTPEEVWLPPEEEEESTANQDRIPPELSAFQDVFEAQNSKIMPPRKETDHSIDLKEDASPPYGPIYPLSQAELAELRKYLDENLENGRIRPSKSPAGAPILFVPKKDGGLRLCVDYRGLNKVSVKNRYPLPLISEILDRLSGARFLSKIDVQDAYYRIRIREGEEWKTAFRTRYGHFEYMVMPFGLTNAPATFQSYIHTALYGLLDTICIAYLDDILIFSKTREEHTKHLSLVLERLRKAQLFVKASKCSFYKLQVEFLGFIVGQNGISMDPERVRAIQEWEQPTSYRDIQVFLGFCNFYRRFIEKYSLIALPLTELLKGSKDGKKPGSVELNDRESKAFRDLLYAFSTAPLLRYFDPERPIRLETDASGFGMAGILSQPDDQGVWHPIAFWSKKFSSTERNYATPDQELFAIVYSFKHWRQYLEGSRYQVEVLTDHHNLRLFMNQPKINGRQARWCLFLTPFDFVIHHRSGKTNPADGLSRTPGEEKAPPAEEILGPIRKRITAESFVKVQWFTVGTRPSGEESGGEQGSISATALARGSPSLSPSLTVSSLSSDPESEPNQVQNDTAAPMDQEDLGEATDESSEADHSDPGDNQEVLPSQGHNMTKFLPSQGHNMTYHEVLSRSQFVPPRMVFAAAANEDPLADESPRELKRLIKELQENDKMVQERTNAIIAGNSKGKHWSIDSEKLLCYKNRLYIPVEGKLRRKLIELHHDEQLAGHFGRTRTEELLKRKFYWEKLPKDVREYVETCPICQGVKAPRHRPYGELQSLPIPYRPFAELSMDFITGLPTVIFEGRECDAILVIVCRLTKFSRFLPVSTTMSAGDLAELFFDRIELEYGNPEGIVSDRGPIFTSRFWSRLCYHSKIKLRFSTAFHPQTDGQTERLNQVLEDYLRCFVDGEQSNWARLLKMAQFACNNAVNASTNETPFRMLLGYNPDFQVRAPEEALKKEAPSAEERVIHLQNIREEASRKLRIAQETQQKSYNKNHKPKDFEVGTLVSLSTKNIRFKAKEKKLSPRRIGPFRILAKIGAQAYRIALPEKYSRLHNVFSVSLLEPWNSRNKDDSRMPMPELEDEEEWEVEEIRDERTFDGTLHYYVKWTGWPSEYNQWEPADHLKNAQGVINSFRRKKTKKTVS